MSAVTKALQRALATVPRATIAGRVRTVLRVDVADSLMTLEQPMVYLKASDDRLVPSKAAKPFEAANCPVINISAPHFLLQANPGAAAKALASFIGGLPDHVAPLPDESG